MNKNYSYGKQYIDDDDIESVINILKSDMLTQGPTLKHFEDALCKKIGAKYASVVSNGTAALHLTGLVLGWKKNDIVLTTPLTFLATANCIVYAGATPDFVDINKNSYTIDADKLENKIKDSINKGKKVKAVIGVDYAGHPCSWKELRQLADKYGFQLINDACHALGAKYKNDIQYALKYADIVIYSFHPVKPITTGEGGAVLSNNKALDEKIKLLRTHGIEKKSDWYYEMYEPGFNYRITDIQCALGLNQLKKLEFFIKQRQNIAFYYDNIFKNNDRFILPKKANEVDHSYHLYPLQIKFDEVRISKNDLLNNLKSEKILCQVHYIPIHLQPYYKKKFGFRNNDFPVAEQFYKQEMSLPIYPQLEKEDIIYISDIIKKLVR